MDNIKELAIFLKSKNCQLLPCSEEEVNSIEQYFNIKLPDLYKEFLLTMGNGAGQFMRGSSVFVDELHELRDGAIELIRDNNLDFSLPDNAFVFWLHQGYQMAYFIADGPIELPVYCFAEGNGMKGIELTFNSFMGFLKQELRMSGIY